MDIYPATSPAGDAAPGRDQGAEALLEELAWLRLVARALLGREQEAEDLVQDVLLEAVRQKGTTGELTKPRLRTWLRTVAQRKAWRGRKRAGVRRYAEDQAGPGREDGQSAPDEALEWLELQRELTHEIEQLNPRDRNLLVQRYLQGLSPRAIAAELGVAPSVVRGRLTRALDSLRSRLRATSRGDSWMVGLALLAGTPPRILASGTAGAAALATLPWMMMKLLLVAGALALSVSVLWLARSTDAPVRDVADAPAIARGPEAEAAALGVPGPAASTRLGSGQGTVREPAKAAPPASARPGQLRAVRVDGAPVPGALGALVPTDGEASFFAFDAKGVASVPAGFEGYAFAAAPGLANARIELGEGYGPGDLALVLGEALELNGFVTVGGLPPGTALTLKRYLLHAEAGLDVLPSASRSVLREGRLVPQRVEVAVAESGALRLELPWVLAGDGYPQQVFACPPAFLVSSVNGQPVTANRAEITLPAGEGRVHIELERLPALRGRLRWKDTREPVEGIIAHQRLDAAGRSMDGFPSLELDGQGGFLVPVVALPRGTEAEAGPLAATLLLHVQDPPAARGLRFRFPLAGQELPWDVGDLEVERAQSLPVAVRGRRPDGSLQPLRAGLIGPDSEAQTGSDGRGTIPYRPGQTLEVLSAGWHYRQIILPQGVFTAAAPFEIDLEPAPRLTLVGCDSLRFPAAAVEPLVRIDFDWTPYETAELDGEQRGVPYGHRLHRSLAAAIGGAPGFGRWNHAEPGAPGYVDHRLPAGDSLDIAGIVAGRPFRVQVVDGLGQRISSEEVMLSDSRRVDLGHAQRAAAALVCRILWDDRSPVNTGKIQVRGGAGRSLGLTFEAGRFELPCLAAETLELEIAASGALPASVEVSLRPGEERELTVVLARSE